MNNTSNLSITETITHYFHLPTEHLKICDKYYILYWQAKHLYTQILKSPRIIREGIGYVPVLQDDLSLEIIGVSPEAQIRLSFRRIRGHRTGYVVIRSAVKKV